MDLQQSWNAIKVVFPVLNDSFTLVNITFCVNVKLLNQYSFKPFPSVNNEEFFNATNIIKTLNATEAVQFLIINNTEKYMRKNVTVEFWSYFAKKDSEYLGFQQLYKAVQILYNYYLQFANIMEKVDTMREHNGITI